MVDSLRSARRKKPRHESTLTQRIPSLIALNANLRSARDQLLGVTNAELLNSTSTGDIWGPLQAAQPKLPAIPIAKFLGKVWEYTNFWALISANVHDQPLTKLQKFNYLLTALTEEAREVVRYYPITEENYDSAIELLRQKYGDHSKSIATLQTRLEKARADNHTIPAKRILLEYVIPIVTQLEKLGMSLDGSYLAQKILAKFTPSIQQIVFERRIISNTQEGNWRMQDILKGLDNYITTEERINDMVKRNVSISEQTRTRVPQRSSANKPYCLFCKSDSHKSGSCMKFPTISGRPIMM
ncbi:hypothetical protein ANCDUO_01306 [Ancylostoma duodenale]|uniref:Peptidase family A16 n=1 Tax=Ancylostoma duodenale TaxID=51022 RepID=A0A0C2DEK1_9BILA|nr:hypothetical protein ANCDUO_01306 [Ancylostoma duodenale]